MIKFSTSGESHGKMLSAIIENIPAGLKISEDYINNELRSYWLGSGDMIAKFLFKDRAYEYNM